MPEVILHVMRSRLHRFYVGDSVTLSHDFWVHDERLIWQWRKVLRMQPGQQLVLFDGIRSDRLYTVLELTEREAHVHYVTDFERQLPAREVYLAWALVKKDKNDWVLQKATEIGVSHFVPLLAERSEKTGFSVERAEKIVIEAAEQCGRSDIPKVREPMTLHALIDELGASTQLCVCEQGNDPLPKLEDNRTPRTILVGPEGGWSDAEKTVCMERQIPHIGLGTFTLRAETAAVIAASVAMS